MALASDIVCITQIPIDDGFWVPWSPHSIGQEWPFCWHVLTMVDHYSRRVMGFRVFPKALTTKDVIQAIEDTMAIEGVRPEDIVSDRGPQFDNDDMKKWCKGKSIDWRHGKVGEHGSIAVIERYHRSLKSECTRRIIVPNVLEDLVEELKAWTEYYNGERPH